MQLAKMGWGRVFCTECGNVTTEGSKFCSECGNAMSPLVLKKNAQVVSSEVQTEGSTSLNIKRDKFFIRLKVLAFLFLAAILVTLVASLVDWILNDSSNSETGRASPANSETTPIPEERDWFPAGFQEINSLVAYKKVPSDVSDCGYSSAHGCFQIYVVTAIPCQVFVEVNFEVDGVVVDSSIDSAVLGTDQQAIMEFVSFKTPDYSGDKTVRFTSATCY